MLHAKTEEIMKNQRGLAAVAGLCYFRNTLFAMKNIFPPNADTAGQYYDIPIDSKLSYRKDFIR